MSQAATEAGTLLEVCDLVVEFPRADGRDLVAVNGVSFRVGEGEIVGLLGESGCGKTTTALALLGLLPSTARVRRGAVTFRGTDLLGLSQSELQEIRGAAVSFLFQDPALALNPFLRVGEQVAEVAAAHRPWSRRRCREEAQGLLARLGLPAPAHAAYPHELSGGQRQRVAIAQGIVCGPSLLIADEPTTALDDPLKAEVLHLFAQLKDRFVLALLVISHDLTLMDALADRVLVMYAGRIVEEGPVRDVFAEPLHPYTAGLLAVHRSMNTRDRTAGRKLPSVAGASPDLARLPPGCAFEPRCPDRLDACGAHAPEEVRPLAARRVRCLKHGE